jgi:predicted Zn-dependent protease
METAFAEMDTEITPQDAYFLGRAVAANILSIYKPYTENPALTKYVNLICQSIVINSSQIEIYNGYHVLILDTPEFNAFATPGGHVFITRGLVESTISEDMLAAVIAHELAHIMMRHGINMINNMRFNDEMTGIADRAFDFIGGNSAAARRLAVFHNSVSKMIDTMVINGYSQAQEFEADREAIILLAASGYNPLAILDVLKVLQNMESTQRTGLNTTHPSAWERIENVEKWIGSRQVRDMSSYREPRFRNK